MSPTRSQEDKSLARELLTDEEFEVLIAQCPNTSAGFRDYTLLLLLDGTGCRVSEVLALEPRDLQWKAGRAKVRHGKGDLRRSVPVAPRALTAVREWLDRRKIVGIADDAPICCNLQGKSLSSTYVRKMLRRLVVIAGIDKRVTPHGLRHRSIVRLTQGSNTMNLYLIEHPYPHGYMFYEGAVVAAASEDDARLVRPDGKEWEGKDVQMGEWCDADEVKVTLIGSAKAGTARGVVFAVYRGG